MPKIRDDVVRAVLDRAKIEDVVGEFVTLRRAGVNMTGICPFHDDKHDGNFIVRPSTISEKNGGNTYHCFVCMRTGEGGGPVDFLMKAEHMTFPDAIRWLGRKYCVEVDDVPVNWTPPPPRPTPPPLPALVMQRLWVKELMEQDYNKNIFTYWYGKLPWNPAQRQRMKQTLWMYCVGCYKDGRVVFWYIDHDGVPRAAKLMRYEPDGHRHKEQKGERNSTGWLYNQEGYRDVCRPDEHTIIKPLFGAHLLKRYPKADVNVVESEKTALIMSNYYGCPENHLWLACGGLKFLNLDAMQVLVDQGRRVWLWPDKDGMDDWQKVADKLGSDRVNIYTKFFETCWREEDGPKADAADITIRMMRKPETIEETNHTGDPQPPTELATAACAAATPDPPKPDGISDEEWTEHLKTLAAIHEWTEVHGDEPFLDPLEQLDPRVREWREILRRRYNFNKRYDKGTEDSTAGRGD